MGKYSFVLSDTLYKQYYLFKEHQDYDKDIILHLLKFRCGEFLTNTRQLIVLLCYREYKRFICLL